MVAYYRYYMVKFDKKNQKGKLDEKASKKDRYKGPAGESDKVAKKPRRYKLSQEGLSGRDSKLGGKVHGVREGAGGYKPPEETSEEGEEKKKTPKKKNPHYNKQPTKQKLFLTFFI